jgi:hypothetical protein
MEEQEMTASNRQSGRLRPGVGPRDAARHGPSEVAGQMAAPDWMDPNMHRVQPQQLKRVRIEACGQLSSSPLRRTAHSREDDPG